MNARSLDASRARRWAWSLLPLALGLSACGEEQLTVLEDSGVTSDAGQVADSGAAVADGGAAAGDSGTAVVDSGTTVTDAGGAEDAGTTTSDAGVEPLPHFSFFVTSLEAMLALSGSEDGFGGDLRFGQATGLAGADAICTAIAEGELQGSGGKVWRAFLSASTDGQGGGQVNAIDRIGSGPWYDRNGRLVAQDLQGLMGTRPDGDPVISSDLPNERGESQKNQPGPGAQGTADNHDILTGSTRDGRFQGGSMASTCNDWTSTTVTGRPYCGHSWPAQSGQSWIQAHPVAGCAAVVNLVQNGPGSRDCIGVGCGGGYGGLYCFALEP